MMIVAYSGWVKQLRWSVTIINEKQQLFQQVFSFSVKFCGLSLYAYWKRNEGKLSPMGELLEAKIIEVAQPKSVFRAEERTETITHRSYLYKYWQLQVKSWPES